MPKGLREISNRIKSVRSTAQITRAMQLVASSKMRRAQETALAGRDYTRLLSDVLDSALAGLAAGEGAHPLTEPRAGGVRGVLLVTTDKGLCGALNANLFRRLVEIPASAKFVTVGRKGSQHLSRAGRTLLAEFPVSDKLSFAETRRASEYLLKLYLDGVVDTVEVLYPRFKNTLVQEAVLETLLPIADMRAAAAAARARLGVGDANANANAPADATGAATGAVPMNFEPSAGAVLAELPALFVKNAVYHAIIEARASEHSARMVAMKAATDNAGKITDALTLDFNKARQAAITQEINEITAAALAA
ncbi:MAG: ATP synthase F1 subunit gamma [Puniceicoccales bacterium]|jgi:F-type H+-transporting ATPase subunit gamma|nr:ATP synthase F1 subunit gamma [Puniceicoccales bacterium]